MNQTTNANQTANPTAKELVVRLIDDAQREGHRIRYTVDADGVPDKIAAIDAVAELCGCDNSTASHKFVEVGKKNANLETLEQHQFPGAGQRLTPVVRPSELVRVISALPRGKYQRVDQFQRACSTLVTRYVGGDMTLAAEVAAANNAYESGEVAPDHPLQAFRTEAGELRSESIMASDPRVLEMLTAMNESMKSIMASSVEIKESNAKLVASNTEMKHEISTMRTQIQSVSRDRVIRPEDAGHDSVFILYDTHTQYRPKASYPFCIVKCHHQYEEANDLRIRDRYPNATVVVRLDHPNADALFQVLRENSEQLGIKFFRTGFATLEDTHIDEVLQFIRDAERTRLSLA